MYNYIKGLKQNDISFILEKYRKHEKNYQIKYNKSNIITVTDKNLLSKTSRHPIIKNLSNRNYIIT